MKHKSLIFVALLAGAAPAAYAQPSDPGQLDTTPLARRLFNEGVDAAHRLDWAVALDRFGRSNELSPRPLTLYNLAGAEVATNRIVRGIESYRKFLRETSDGTYPDFRKEAQTVIATLEPKIGWAKLIVNGMVHGDTLMLDSDSLVTAALGESLPIDPGQHVLIVKRQQGQTSVVAERKEFTMTEGGSKTVTIDLPPPPAPPVEAPINNGVTGTQGLGANQQQHQEPAKPKEYHWYTSPLVWTGVVAGVAAISGGTYLYIHSRPFSSNLDPINVTGKNAP